MGMRRRQRRAGEKKNCRSGVEMKKDHQSETVTKVQKRAGNHRSVTNTRVTTKILVAAESVVTMLLRGGDENFVDFS